MRKSLALLGALLLSVVTAGAQTAPAVITPPFFSVPGTPAIGDLLCGSGAAAAFTRVPAVAVGQVLVSAGVGVCPGFSASPTLTSLALGTNPAAAGELRLPSSGAINVRNVANTNNLLAMSADDTHVYLGQGGLAVVSGSADNSQDLGIGGTHRWRFGYFGTALVVGTNPATTGTIRLPYAGAINARNQTNAADVSVIGLDTISGEVNTIPIGGTGINVTPGSNNSQDFGRSATTWRTGYFGTSVESPVFKTTTALVGLGGGAAPTVGTIGGTGPTVAAQNSWLRMIDSTGAVFWVPVWK